MAATPQHGGVVDQRTRQERPGAHGAMQAEGGVIVALGVLPVLERRRERAERPRHRAYAGPSVTERDGLAGVRRQMRVERLGDGRVAHVGAEDEAEQAHGDHPVAVVLERPEVVGGHRLQLGARAVDVAQLRERNRRAPHGRWGS